MSISKVRVSNVDSPNFNNELAFNNMLSIDALTNANVKRYGAKGDGKTDDTLAIQAAIDTIRQSGGKVFFPEGNYLISKALHLYEGITLEGNSQTSTFITQNSIYAHVEANDCNYVTIKNITFEGPGINAAGGGGIVFGRRNNANIMGVNIENVTVQHCVGVGISISCPIVSVFNNVRVMGIAGSGFSFYQSGTSITMNSCYAITCTQAGYDFGQMNYTTLNACAVEVCGIGYYLHHSCNNIALVGCGAEDQIERRTIDGVEYKGVDYQIEGGAGNSLVSCYSRNNTFAGIVAKGGNPSIIGYRQIGTAEYGILSDKDSKIQKINIDCASKVQLSE